MLAGDNTKLIQQLREQVGAKHVLTSAQSTRRYATGFRFGGGPVLAVVRPGSLREQWRVLNLCVSANKIIIMQAANTGLTGGSTPDGTDYDREIVIINTLRMATVHLIDNGRQVICLPGATLFQLEKMLRPLGREPHSVIGSSCIGASVFGGVCNNSGGALIRRGPAFTQLALFAQVDAQGKVRLVNHLGVRLGNDPETMLAKLESGDFDEGDTDHDPSRAASDGNYAQYVRDTAADTPARYNADPQRLYEASGSAGKVMLFAVRLDTFEMEAQTAVFYIGTNDVSELTRLRRDLLETFSTLPIAAEYLHRDAFDIAEKYGKDMFLTVQFLGTDRLPALFALKARFDALAARLKFLPRDLSDRLMQIAGTLFPVHLPKRMKEYRDKFEHHLMLKMSGPGIAQARDYLAGSFPSADAAFFECTPEEGKKAFLHRFATAGAAIRYRVVHHREVEDIVALDIALARNTRDWFETLPAEIEAPILHKLYYGHFFCYVFHQDYIVRKGADTLALEHQMWKLLDQRGAQYPAEHNVGHLYEAKPALAAHYKDLDPCNCFNPGIGKTSKRVCWE
ncbi:MAG: D-lactate dehydrogenase [Acidocella sp. 20-63-7]|nr:MAG: D-lactate dehydrogenase [Acidocella sp. 20-63-7]HQT46904.1 D-lactate dehydrogenase [Acidocella sp.]